MLITVSSRRETLCLRPCLKGDLPFLLLLLLLGLSLSLSLSLSLYFPSSLPSSLQLLCAMFVSFSGMRESSSGIVQVTDVSPKIFKYMLYYLYSGALIEQPTFEEYLLLMRGRCVPVRCCVS
jgi:BTB/POZ domain